MAGCGFGGSCLPKDVSALVAHGRSVGQPMNLLASVLDINAKQPDQVFRLLGKHFPSLGGKRIAVLGLSFRPDTNDMRESPAIPIVRRLVAEKAVVSGYDPAAREEAAHLFGNAITLCDSLAACLKDAEAVVLVTRWKEFNQVPGLLKAMAKPPVLIDGRRMLAKDSVPRYEGIGL
jgi:UDPglucose 6-dehydrogenase/GDP-mannose 6-dehydrogenase